MSSIASNICVPLNIEWVFNNPETERGEFWHYAAKHYRNPSDYRSLEVIDKISSMVEGGRENPFQKQAIYGWTPLHVASIANNQAAITFLFKQRVDQNIQDEFGKKAIDYTERELLSLFCLLHSPSDLIKSAIGETLIKWTKPLPSLHEGGYRANTDDFGKEIKSIVIGSRGFSNQSMYENTFSNLIDVCLLLGIKSNLTPKFYVRDTILRLHDGEMLQSLISTPKNLEEALQRTESYDFYFNKKPSTRTHNPFYKVLLGKNFENSSLPLQTVDKKIKAANFHFEGGNILTVTNPEGQPQVLIGRTHRLLTLQLYRLDPILAKKIEKKFAAERLQKIKRELSADKIKELAEHLFAQGCLKQNGKSGFISLQSAGRVFWQEQLAGTPPGSFLEDAIQMGIIPRFTWGPNCEKKYCHDVANYCLQEHLTHENTAASLKVDPSSVHYISQLGYHLDLFLKPGPNHSVFLQDFAMCLEILQNIKKNSDSLGLTEKDRNELERYVITAEKFQRELGGLVEIIQTEIQNTSGLTVVPMPGIFMHEPELFYDGTNFKMKTENVNFMNALSGWSSKRENYFYITTGAKVGDNLGRILMDAFHCFLDHYIPDIEVFFLGKDCTNPSDDYFEPMHLWNTQTVQAGVHCFTFETKTENH